MVRVYVNDKGYRKPKTVYHKRFRSERKEQWNKYYKCLGELEKEGVPATFRELDCYRRHLSRKPRL